MSEDNTIYKEWVFHDVTYIYAQLAEKLERAILSGQLSPGDRLPAIREMTELLQINPNTVARAYRFEADCGLLVSIKGQYSVIADERYISHRREETAKGLCCSYLSNMFAVGFSKDEVSKFFGAYVSTLNLPTKGECSQHE